MSASLVGPLLLSSDKDEDEISKLGVLVRSFTCHLNQWLGGCIIPKLLDENQVGSVISTLLYYSATHGTGVQTLGEELNLLVLHRNRKVPTLLFRVMYILLQALGTNKLLDLLCKVIPGTKANLIKQIKLPLSLLAMHGGNILCQKLLGFENHPLKKPSAKLYPFYVIILCDVMYVLVELYKRHKKQPVIKDPENTALDESTGIECTICTECVPVGQLATSPCGHVGCWNCLNRAALLSDTCPVCKGPIFPLLSLRNIRYPT